MEILLILTIVVGVILPATTCNQLDHQVTSKESIQELPGPGNLVSFYYSPAS